MKSDMVRALQLAGRSRLYSRTRRFSLATCSSRSVNTSRLLMKIPPYVLLNLKRNIGGKEVCGLGAPVTGGAGHSFGITDLVSIMI